MCLITLLYKLKIMLILTLKKEKEKEKKRKLSLRLSSLMRKVMRKVAAPVPCREGRSDLSRGGGEGVSRQFLVLD